MEFSQKLIFTAFISLFVNAFASSELPDLSDSNGSGATSKDMALKMEELKSSFDRISAVTMKATRDLAKAGAESMQDSLKTANDSLTSLMTTVYALIEPIIKTQTVYKSADGKSYVIPTASISIREKFSLDSFKTDNDKRLKEKNSSVSTNLPVK